MLRINLTKQLSLVMANKEKEFKQALETEREKVSKITDNLKE